MIVESYAAGTPSWVDLMTSDQDAAIDFYGDLFGWESVRSGPELGDYAMCMKDGQPVAGIGPLPEDAAFPAAWTTYLAVDDVDDIVAKVEEAGGQIMAPAMTVEGEGRRMGRMAVIADPSGGVFGVWQAMEHHGSGRANEPGSFTWNELMSRDPDAAREFLGAVFGYEWEAMPPMDGMVYHIAKLGDQGVAGVGSMPAQIPAEVPSFWQTYFAVADTDDSVARAVASGATLMAPAFDSPFGRMAVLADSQGASFSVITLNPETTG